MFPIHNRYIYGLVEGLAEVFCRHSQKPVIFFHKNIVLLHWFQDIYKKTEKHVVSALAL